MTDCHCDESYLCVPCLRYCVLLGRGTFGRPSSDAADHVWPGETRSEEQTALTRGWPPNVDNFYLRWLYLVMEVTLRDGAVIVHPRLGIWDAARGVYRYVLDWGEEPLFCKLAPAPATA